MSDASTVCIRICQEGHANALALNKDCTQIAIAGRNLLKVFCIESDGFTEVCNMHSGKNQNLSYSSNDVAWSSLDNNILATAATNGAVSVWDLSKFGRHKQQLVYYEHERTAHRVTFHSTDQNLLLSGSRDGTIKCFDIRLDKSVNTYYSNSESVRDVKFNPHSTNTFAAVSENGTVQLWDIRRPDKCSLRFTAHSGPIYTCDWHPNKNWLATGSRDKQIKIWNMEGKASLEHTIHTIAVVGRVKWRPDKMYHIASCALLVDYSIYIWDIRRPYIPFAAFNEHTNVTTGIAWKGNDPHVLLSTSTDSTLYKHIFKDAIRPSLKANPQGAAMNFKGNLLYTYKVKFSMPYQSNNIRNTFMTQRSKPPINSDQFHMAQSSLHNFIMQNKSTSTKDKSPFLLKDDECFIGCAREYILSGKDLSEICEHNANVSKKFGKYNATLLWNFMKYMYGTSNINNKKSEVRNILSSQNMIRNRRPTQQTSQLDTKWNSENKDQRDDQGLKGSLFDDLKMPDFICPKGDDLKLGLDDLKPCTNPTFDKSQLTFENVKNLRDGFLYVGPHDLTRAVSLPEAALHDLQAARPKPDMKNEQRVDPSPPPDPPMIIRVSALPSIPVWEPLVIADCLTLQTDAGDVQTSVCILIVLGENRNGLPIDESIYETWFHSYIELLYHHQLWNEATQIINLSWIRSVRELNQQSTAAHTNCGECGRPLLGSTGWYCNKCKSTDSSKCSVCHLVVRGLYAWCQGCSHGGHLEHMKQWFSYRSKCPRCGHLCEYE